MHDASKEKHRATIWALRSIEHNMLTDPVFREDPRSVLAVIML